MEELVRFASRGGKLAIAQAKTVASALERAAQGLKVEIKTISTRGDRDRRTALWELEDSGFFTTQVADAVLNGRADIAVHSFKDLPTKSPEGLMIAAVCDRRFVEDCMVSAVAVKSLEELKSGAKIGTSSLRRSAQIKRIRPDLQVLPTRGNVETRLRRIEEGEFDAMVLARAGLERLGLSGRVSIFLEPSEFIPAPAQGALAIQVRKMDTRMRQLAWAVNDEQSRITSFAERQILVSTRCGCRAPVGAFAKISGAEVKICAFMAEPDGTQYVRDKITGPVKDAVLLADKLAKRLLDMGGDKILDKLKR